MQKTNGEQRPMEIVAGGRDMDGATEYQQGLL